MTGRSRRNCSTSRICPAGSVTSCSPWTKCICDRGNRRSQRDTCRTYSPIRIAPQDVFTLHAPVSFAVQQSTTARQTDMYSSLVINKTNVISKQLACTRCTYEFASTYARKLHCNTCKRQICRSYNSISALKYRIVALWVIQAILCAHVFTCVHVCFLELQGQT